MNTTLPILALLALVPLSLAQDTRPQDPKPAPSGLDKARALFDKVDLDRNGSVSAAEAGRSRIPGALFVAHDDDRDRALTREEFNLFYRDLLVGAGRAVPQDLAAEASRVEAARRTRKAEEERRRTPRPVDDKPVDEKPVDEKPGAEATEGAGGEEPQGKTEAERVAAAREQAEGERIQEARDDANAKRDERIEKARSDVEQESIAAAREQAGAQDDETQPAQKPQQSQQSQQSTEAERVAAARAKAEAERIENARAKAEADRIAKAREAQPVVVGAGDPARGATPQQRAAGYVKRLVDGGRLTPAQARDYYAFLTAPQSTGDVAPDQIAVLRTAHTRAKNRISDIVVAGGLSAEEGRQLATALDDRARAMLPAPEPVVRPVVPPRRDVREETPVRGPGPAPERRDATPPNRGGGETPPPAPERRGSGDGKGRGEVKEGERGNGESEKGARGGGEARRGTDGASARRRDG